MLKSKKRKVYLARDVNFQDPDSPNYWRVRKSAGGLVLAGMLLMFPKLIIACGEFPIPWPSFWTSLFFIGALMNMGAYACLAFGWRFDIRHIGEFVRLKKMIGIGGGPDDGRK